MKITACIAVVLLACGGKGAPAALAPEPPTPIAHQRFELAVAPTLDQARKDWAQIQDTNAAIAALPPLDPDRRMDQREIDLRAITSYGPPYPLGVAAACAAPPRSGDDEYVEQQRLCAFLPVEQVQGGDALLRKMLDAAARGTLLERPDGHGIIVDAWVAGSAETLLAECRVIRAADGSGHGPPFACEPLAIIGPELRVRVLVWDREVRRVTLAPPPPPHECAMRVSSDQVDLDAVATDLAARFAAAPYAFAPVVVERRDENTRRLIAWTTPRDAARGGPREHVQVVATLRRRDGRTSVLFDIVEWYEEKPGDPWWRMPSDEEERNTRLWLMSPFLERLEPYCPKNWQEEDGAGRILWEC